METFEKPAYSVQIVLQSYNAEVTFVTYRDQTNINLHENMRNEKKVGDI